MFKLKQLFKKAKLQDKTIVLPEASLSERVMEAAIIINKTKLAKVIILGDIEELKIKYNKKLDGINIINPKTYKETPNLANTLYGMRKDKGLSEKEAEDLIRTNHIYFAVMLLNAGLCDAVISGAETTTADTLRPALQIIKSKNKGEIVSSCFLITGKNKMLKNEGVMFLADCGLNQKPTAEELATIASQTVLTAKQLTDITPRVAFLSYSTKGSGKSEEVEMVREAAKLFKEKYPEVLSDGELQLDASLIPFVASKKAKNSDVAGRANILIFPNLEAGNICYKAIQYFGGVLAVGPIIQGLKKPVNDLSRGANVREIVITAAISILQ